MQFKTCRRCSISKPLSDFVMENSLLLKRSIYCKSCESEIRKLRNQGLKLELHKTKPKTQTEFEEKFYSVENRIDYRVIGNYIKASKHINIECPIHGIFSVKPVFSFGLCPCPECRKEILLKIKNFDDFVSMASKFHNGKYTYEKPNNFNMQKKIKVYCIKHDHNYEITASDHLFRGIQGCLFCSGTGKLDTETFIKKSKMIYGDKYDYTMVEYKSSFIPVSLKCNECYNNIEVIPNSFLQGKGCNICSQNINYDTTGFISRSKELYGDKYDYTQTNYMDRRSEIKIKCVEHDITFITNADHHLNKNNNLGGCPICSQISRKSKVAHSFDDFIKLAIDKHGEGKYLYDRNSYTDFGNKIRIFCIKCNEWFETTARNHTRSRHKKCATMSIGEEMIMKLLIQKDITYKYNVHYSKDLRHIKMLSVDFILYRGDEEIFIEFDGIHHYEMVQRSKSDTEEIMMERLLLVKTRDEIKNIFFRSRNLKLLRIPYWEIKHIEKIIDDFYNSDIIPIFPNKPP